MSQVSRLNAHQAYMANAGDYLNSALYLGPADPSQRKLDKLLPE
jgi:hypothetical protein